MPKTQPAPQRDELLEAPVTAPDPTPAPTGRVHTGPLSWVLGGAPRAPHPGASAKPDRHRERAPQRPPPAAGLPRRRSRSSGFRGNR